MRFTSTAIAALAALSCGVAARKSDGENSNPPFFLTDFADGMCLSGAGFKRCSIDTVFYVEGSPGEYKLHKRIPTNSEEDEKCLAKAKCDANDDDALIMAPCTHCGTKKFNIVGDANQGYVVTYDDGNLCLARDRSLGSQASLVPCEVAEGEYPLYSYFNLQFVTKRELEAMEGPSAEAIVLAERGDLEGLKAMLDADKDLLANAKDYDNYTLLQAAAFEGKSDVVDYLLGKGADANEVDGDGITALMKAAVRGHLEVVKALVEGGAEVDATGKNGITAAWLSAGEGREDVLSYLVSKGADLTVTRSDGTTPLMNGSTGTGPGQLEIIKLLCEYYKENNELKDVINAQESTDGMSALHHLVESPAEHTLESIKTLVSYGADINLATPNTGYTPLMIAAAHGYTETVAYFVEEGASLDSQAEGSTALMYAAAAGHSDTVSTLLAAGADIAIQHSNGGTALSEACVSGNVDVVKSLLDAGADPSTLDKNGVSPLMMASSVGSLPIVEQLLSSSAASEFVNAQTESGGFALLYAAGSGSTELVEHLISAGADVTAKAQPSAEYIAKISGSTESNSADSSTVVEGVTALHVAAQGGHKSVVEILTEKSQDLVKVTDSEGRTALTLAVQNNFGSTATLLLEKGSDPNITYKNPEDEAAGEHNLLMDALIVENEDFAKLLIEKGADVSFVDKEGGNVSLLLQASHRGLTQAVAALLANDLTKKEFIDLANSEGVTPLLAAASEGHLETFEALVAAGANINAKESDGTSVLSAAAARGHLDIVQSALKVSDIDLNSQNSDGHTALMFAYNGKSQVETMWERYQQFVAEQQQENNHDGGVDENDPTILRIKEALANHNALIAALISGGADESLKDKEGHVAKDFDFVPESELNAEVLEAERKRGNVKGDEL